MFGWFKKKQDDSGPPIHWEAVDATPLGNDSLPADFMAARPGETDLDVLNRWQAEMDRRQQAREAEVQRRRDELEQARLERELAPYREIAENAFSMLAAEEAFVGKEFSEEERKDKLWGYVLRLVNNYVDQQRAELEAARDEARDDEYLQQMERSNELLRRIAKATENTPINIALRFQQEHPFLAGVLGAEIASRFKQ